MQIIVPDDAAVRGTAKVGAGQIYRFTRTDDGGFHQQYAFAAPGSGRAVTLVLDNGVGEIRIVRASSPNRITTTSTTLQGVAR